MILNGLYHEALENTQKMCFMDSRPCREMRHFWYFAG